MSKLLKRLLCLTLWISASTLWTAGAADAEPTPEQLKELTKQLGDEVFDKRQAAEQALAKAGVKAKDVLTTASNSKDVQTAATAKKLLGKLRFATLGPVDYFDILPEKSLLAVRLNNGGDSWKNLQNTALGKIFLSKSFDPLRAKISENMDKAAQKPLEILKHFQGQVAAAVWEFNPMMGPNGIKAALIIEVTDGDPQTVLNELMQIDGNSKSIGSYQDVEIYGEANGKKIALSIGKNFVFTPDEDSAKFIIDRFLETAPKGFNQNAAFIKTKAALGGKNELLFSMDLMEMLKPMMPMLAMTAPGLDDVLKSLGVENVKLMTYSGTIVGDTFEERFVAVTEGPLTGLMGTYADAPAGAIDEALSLIPANAVGGAVKYVDGEKSAKALGDYFAAAIKMQESKNKNGPNPFAVFAEAETKMGIKFADLAAALKGTASYWAVLAPGLTPPDIGAFVTFADAAKAKTLIETLVQNANKEAGKEVVKSVAYKSYAVYQIDALALDASKKCPYPTPSFALVGSRLFFATSSESLQKQLNNLEAKAPGLLSNPDFVKATAHLKADDRKGELIYIDLKPLLVLGGNVGLPMLVATTDDEEGKKFFAGLPPAAELFKDITPVVSFCKNSKDLIMVSIRSPLPVVGTSFMAGLTLPVIARARAKARAGN